MFFEAGSDRVASTDGVYVETMITNGGTLGFMGNLGHANFFPNHGQTQPGCGADTSGNCAHARCVLFYAESINTVFTGRPCTWAAINAGTCTNTGTAHRMGGPNPANLNLRGSFFLPTNAASPFSQG